MNKPLTLITSLIAVGLLTQTAWAGWVLNNDNSALYFVSTKKQVISEIHQFDTLSGEIDDAGMATLYIDLASVNTGVDIRNERMQNYLFETDKFRAASVGLNLGPDGTRSGTRDIMAQLELHGMKKDIQASVLVIENGSTLQVVTTRPVMLSAADFGLEGGIAKLQGLAQLPSINPAVPVTFNLSFDRQ